MKHFYGFKIEGIDQLGDYVGEPKRFTTMEARNNWVNQDIVNNRALQRKYIVRWFEGSVKSMNEYFAEEN